METSAISYRVADFLKKHPPFQAMEEADLVDLAARGRVKFHEANDYILWQGEPHRLHVFVIQQGTVSLWDEEGENATLRDIRGAGDMLGIERFNDARACLHSARSASDVVIYAFPATDFETLLLKYPYARQYVSAHATVTAEYQGAEERRDPRKIFLHDVVGHKALQTCDAQDSIRDVARRLLATGSDAMAVLDSDGRAAAVVTAGSLLDWVAAGGGNAEAPIAGLPRAVPLALAADASVIDAVLAMGAADAGAVAMTADGSPDGRLHAIVTSRDLAPLFGDQPVSILREIRRAADTPQLRALNQRAREFALQYLTAPASLDWLARFTHLTDVAIVRRIIDIAGPPADACWCFCGPSGRGESLTRLAPHVVLILDDAQEPAQAMRVYGQLLDSLVECDYFAGGDAPFDRPFHVARSVEWRTRYTDWVRDPVRTHMYRARPLFDLRPIHGRQSLWQEVAAAVIGAVDRDFLQVLANDCLASLPPLTFFHDAVVDESGEQTAVFRLEHSALRPLVDVGRVFGIAARHVFGSSTLERFTMARTLLPEHESIFREASETLRIVLWQQARIGISQGTAGSELPPALLSRHDRHILKSGFRSIHRLLEFTADPAWLGTL